MRVVVSRLRLRPLLDGVVGSVSLFAHVALICSRNRNCHDPFWVHLNTREHVVQTSDAI